LSYPDHGLNPDMLISRADMAMYMAKQRGKNQFHPAPEGTSCLVKKKEMPGRLQTTVSPS